MKILTQKFNTKHNTAPFSQIKLEDYQPAFEENIAKARAEIDAITNNPEPPTFQNTIEAFDKCGGELLKVGKGKMTTTMFPSSLRYLFSSCFSSLSSLLVVFFCYVHSVLQSMLISLPTRVTSCSNRDGEYIKPYYSPILSFTLFFTDS